MGGWQERSDFRRDRGGEGREEEREPEARDAGTLRVMRATKRGSAETTEE